MSHNKITDIRPGQLWRDRDRKDGSVYIVIGPDPYSHDLGNQWCVLHSAWGFRTFGMLITEDDLLEDSK